MQLQGPRLVPHPPCHACGIPIEGYVFYTEIFEYCDVCVALQQARALTRGSSLTPVERFMASTLVDLAVDILVTARVRQGI